MAACDGLAPQQVLDVGCGTGELLATMAQRWPQTSFTGLDLSAEMLSVAGAKDYNGAEVRLLPANVYEIPLEDDTFDLVTNTTSSHFYLEFERALQEITRVLRPGGRLLMASLSNGPLRFLPGNLGKGISVPGARYRSPAEQKAALEAAGLRVLTIKPTAWPSRLYIATKP